jgi:hypothetical protein
MPIMLRQAMPDDKERIANGLMPKAEFDRGGNCRRRWRSDSNSLDCLSSGR